MGRSPKCDKNGVRKGSWTAEEDRKLIAYVTRYGCWNWRQLPKYAGLARCGKSCRLRWLNYLRPNIKRGNYTPQEEEIIINLHQKLGNKWSAIAAELPGRTDNDIKNHWHTNLKKRFQNKEQKKSDDDDDELVETADMSMNNNIIIENNDAPFDHIHMPEYYSISSPILPDQYSSSTIMMNFDMENGSHDHHFPTQADFWNDPYVTHIFCDEIVSLLPPFLTHHHSDYCVPSSSHNHPQLSTQNCFYHPYSTTLF